MFEPVQILMTDLLKVFAIYACGNNTVINFHATLVFVWPRHESGENSHANSHFSTLINSHATLVPVWPGHESWENSHANSRFSTLINSHATLVLVWPGHESWENSHANSRFSTLIIVWAWLYRKRGNVVHYSTISFQRNTTVHIQSKWTPLIFVFAPCCKIYLIERLR
jgi:hypothetical protein